MPQLSGHRNSLVLALALTLLAPAAGAQNAQPPAATKFSVLLQGRPVGTEFVAVTSSAEGWLISATSSLGPPLNLETSKFQLRYAPDWQPKSLSIEGTLSGQVLTVSTTFTSTSAITDLVQAGQRASVTHAVTPQTLVMANSFYAPYEAVARRLGSAAVGARFQVYVAPQAEVAMTVDKITLHRVTTPTGALDLRQFDLTFANPGGPLTVEVWIDAENRLARVAIPAGGVTVLREDISSVMSRIETISRKGDEDVFVPSTGFSLAGVLSKPSNTTGPAPAVVLVAGSGAQDRDERVFNIPIFGQLANALADAGFVVLRYDKRGVGRSGGRIENATLEDYADDVVNVIEWLRRRPDIDPKRIAIVGHSEGGAVALLAGRRTKRAAALALIAAPGDSGREVTLWQQRHLLDLTNEPEASRNAKIALELKVLDAVSAKTGWDDIPDELRKQADTAWFRSWVRFDPAIVMTSVDQPILIVQGALDTQVPPAHADRLERLSRARKNISPEFTRKVLVPGVNHLLVPAKTGEVSEYPSLGGSTVSPVVTNAISDWLKVVLAPAKK
jgi:uncharacterized protein